MAGQSSHSQVSFPDENQESLNFIANMKLDPLHDL